jgi:hypothetical protein
MAKSQTAIRALLQHSIDYAGLFPPANLDMKSAVANYVSYQLSDFSWMLGRFIVPLDRLEEFERVAKPYFRNEEWRVSVLGSLSGKQIHAEGYVVDCSEQKLPTTDGFKSETSVPSYLEVSTTGPDSQLKGFIDTISRLGGRAKIRTGGVTADAFPTTSRIARFLSLCFAASVPFKATAGLHHPIRGVHPYTYEVDSPRGEMNGFLNLFLAAAAISDGASEKEAILLLEDKSARAFNVTDGSISWRDRKFYTAQLDDLRNRFAIGFGSCSFDEPVNDLKALGFLS